MARYPRRYLIVPDAEVDAAALVVAQSPLDEAPQQAGLSVRQATLDPDDVPRGDMRPTISGVPEGPVGGTLRITRSGPTDLGRFGWVRDDADIEGDLQFRQSPLVFGRRTDCLRRSTTTWAAKPKALVLASGKVLLLYIEQNDASTRADGTNIDGTPMYSVLDPADDTWSTPLVVDGADDGPGQLAGIDAVQFPDAAAEILMVTARQNTWDSPATDRRFYVHHSLDDGLTWHERARLFCEGEEPDVNLGADTDPIVGLACELLDSGRVLIVAITLTMAYSVTSDDRGHTWSTRAIHEVTSGLGGAVAAAKMRNGVVLVLTSSASGPCIANATGNGVDFSEDMELIGTTPATATGVAVAMRPDGWAQGYLTIRSWGVPSGGSNFRDWIAGRTFGVRDPNMGTTADDLMPAAGVASETFGRWLGMHAVETPSRVNYPNSGEYGGFLGIEAINYRGQLLVIAGVVRETGVYDSGSSPPELAESSLMVYRASYWQPLQERLAYMEGLPLYPVWGRAYNRTWDCYGSPAGWGFAEIGGSGSHSAAGGDGGYWAIDEQASYSDITLPNPDGGRNGVVRALVYVEQGGSSTANDIALIFQLFDGAAGAGVTLRFERAGGFTKVAVVNNASGAAIGSADFAEDQWLEVLVGLSVLSGGASVIRVYGRSYDRAADPDWESGYTSVAGAAITTSPTIGDLISFGHYTSATPTESRWKHVHLHRPDDAFPLAVPMGRWGSDFVDSDSATVFVDTGRPFEQNDGGVDNIMRSSQVTTQPRQWVSGGIHAAWRGAALTQGNFDFAPGYDYGAANVLIEPVLREWRSLETGKGVELIFDAGTRSVRPTALAVFGRNFPGLTVQLGDDDGAGGYDWGAAYVLGYPGSGLGEQRHTHLWSLLAGGEWTYLVRERRVTVFPPEGAGPWRPHQFRSVSGGPQFYWTIRNLVTGDRFVFRIEDNTADTLLLGTAPIAGDLVIVGENGPVWAASWSIFSDRFAVLIDHRLPATFTAGAGVYSNSHVRGWRFLRLYMPDVTHVDADAAFYRLGRVILGQAIDLSAPDYQWGWSRSQSSGVELSETTGGARYSARRRPGRRTLSLDYAHMLPPPEADAVLYSPAEQPSMRSWAAWLDVVRRLELDATPAALVFDGERAYAETGEDLVQVASDPEDLRLVRCTSAGTVEHTGWVGRDMNLADGVKCVPRPVCTIRGITFEEEL